MRLDVSQAGSPEFSKTLQPLRRNRRMQLTVLGFVSAGEGDRSFQLKVSSSEKIGDPTRYNVIG